MNQKDTIQKKKLTQKRKDLLKAVKDFKTRQTKNKRSAKEAMGVMQTDNKKKVRAYLLYMWGDQSDWFKLAHRTSLEQSILVSLPKVRLKSAPPTVLQLQHQPWRNGSGLLLKYAWGDRARSNGSTPKRPTGKRKSHGSLSKINR